MIIDRFEFDDPDDPHKNWPPKLTFTPEAMVIALPNGKCLTHKDQVVMGQLLRIAYAQGKRIGLKILNEQIDKELEKSLDKLINKD